MAITPLLLQSQSAQKFNISSCRHGSRSRFHQSSALTGLSLAKTNTLVRILPNLVSMGSVYHSYPIDSCRDTIRLELFQQLQASDIALFSSSVSVGCSTAKLDFRFWAGQHEHRSTLNARTKRCFMEKLDWAQFSNATSLTSSLEMHPRCAAI